MIVSYSPVDNVAQQFEFDPARVRAVQAEAIEKRYGGTWDEFRVAVLQGSVRARRVLLWHLLKAQHATLRLDDVDYAVGELVVEMTRAELVEFRDATVKANGITDEQRDKALAALDAEIAATPGDVEGKAL